MNNDWQCPRCGSTEDPEYMEGPVFVINQVTNANGKLYPNLLSSTHELYDRHVDLERYIRCCECGCMVEATGDMDEEGALIPG